MPTLTPNDLRAIMPRSGTQADAFAGALTSAMAAHGIILSAQCAAFLAQISVETGDLQRLEENLDYTAQRLMQVWPHRFPTIAAAQNYAHNPAGLGNHVYAGRNGNGDEASGDGFAFRGRGLIQVTGRANYRKIGYEADPDSMAQPQAACLTAASFWQINGFNHATQDALNRSQFDAVTHSVNGGAMDADARWQAYQRALSVLLPAQIS